MQTKRTFIVALAGVNLFLLAALIFSTVSPPAAHAQMVTGRAGDFVMATCQASQDFDVLYIIDRPARILHCYAPLRDRSGQVAYVGSLSLANEFRRR